MKKNCYMGIEELREANAEWFKNNGVYPVPYKKDMSDRCGSGIDLLITEGGLLADAKEYWGFGFKVILKKKLKFHPNGYVLSGSDVIAFWHPVDYIAAGPIPVEFGIAEYAVDAIGFFDEKKSVAWVCQSEPDVSGGIIVRDGVVILDAYGDPVKDIMSHACYFGLVIEILVDRFKKLTHRVYEIEPI